MTAYYNEFDPYAAQWLRNLIKKGLIADGEVDDRSITNVEPDDLKGFKQCHFFAGIGGWSLAARLAGWPDERELWTGSAPCQPFSTAGNQKGQEDERHLWPKFFELIRACKPTTIMGEQVSAAIRFGWLDGVSSDLEGEGYTTGSVIIPACAVNAPHRRERLWFVADTELRRCERKQVIRCDKLQLQMDAERESWEPTSALSPVNAPYGNVGYTEHDGQSASSQYQGNGETIQHNSQGANCTSQPKRASSFWDVSGYIDCPDGKARRIEPRIPLLVDGLPTRMVGCSTLSDSKRRKGVLSGFGNAIVPQVAAEIIKAYMEANP